QGASARDVFPGGLVIDHLAPNGAQLSRATYGAPEWTVGTMTSYPSWAAAHVFADGSVLAAGLRVVPYTLPCPCTTHSELLLRRFHADGTVDASFGSGGSVTGTFAADTYVQSLAVTGDG